MTTLMDKTDIYRCYTDMLPTSYRFAHPSQRDYTIAQIPRVTPTPVNVDVPQFMTATWGKHGVLVTVTDPGHNDATREVYQDQAAVRNIRMNQARKALGINENVSLDSLCKELGL